MRSSRTPEALPGQPAGQRGRDAPPPVIRQDVHADLPHGLAVRGASRQPDQLSPVLRADAQYVQLLSIFAERVAPLGGVNIDCE